MLMISEVERCNSFCPQLFQDLDTKLLRSGYRYKSHILQSESTQDLRNKVHVSADMSFCNHLTDWDVFSTAFELWDVNRTKGDESKIVRRGDE